MSTALIADPKSPTALPKNALRRSSFITATPMRAQRRDIERTPVIRQSLTSGPVAGLRLKVLQRSAVSDGTDWRPVRATLDRYLLLVCLIDQRVVFTGCEARPLRCSGSHL